MNSKLQVKLLDELVELQSTRQPYLDENWVRAGIERYFDPDHFEHERQAAFLKAPRIVLHGSELLEPGSFQRLEHAGRPLLVVRGEDGEVRAFYNVCRHRGAQLVGEESGCSKRFSCPYHAWTWSNEGKLIGVPHEKTGFPELDRETLGLHALPCKEDAGWIWVSHETGAELSIADHLGELYSELVDLKIEDMAIYQSDSWEFQANWKLIVEGGLEAYHFRVAHRNTIAPLFLDNLSSYQCFGDHIRSVLPRSHLGELPERAEGDWDIHRYANVLYTLFPTTQFLVQEDHLAWIQLEPLAADRTRLRLSTVVPKAELTARAEHWQKNHDLTVRTLKEDFAIGEGIQRGFASGANSHINFGRFEGALDQFNLTVDRAIEGASLTA
ncbi:MAG: SRPBCC family protein [Pseudomonadota bacterium]